MFDKLLFSKHLYLILKSGIPLVRGLEILKDQFTSKAIKDVLDDVIAKVKRGRSLSESFSLHPEFFSPFFINMVKIGEESGSLVRAISYISSHQEKSYELHRKIKSALIYPAIIFSTALALSFGLVAFVLPRIVPFFKNFNFELPLPTRFLINTATAFQHPLVQIGLTVALLSLVALWILYRYLGWFKTGGHMLLMKLPLFGPLIRMANVAYFSQTMSILLKSGVTLPEALDATRDSSENLIYKKSIQRMGYLVRGGSSLADGIKASPGLFSRVAIQLVDVGEKTGNLETTLSYLAHFYEEEIGNATKNLASVLEPALILFVGALVGFIALSIILPIYEFTRNITI